MIMKDLHHEGFSPLSKQDWFGLTKESIGEDSFDMLLPEIAPGLFVDSYYERDEVPELGKSCSVSFAPCKFFSSPSSVEINSFDSLVVNGGCGLVIDEECGQDMCLNLIEEGVSVCSRGFYDFFECDLSFSQVVFLVNKRNCERPFQNGVKDYCIDVSGLAVYSDIRFEIVSALLQFKDVVNAESAADLQNLWSRLFVISSISSRYLEELIKLKAYQRLFVGLAEYLNIPRGEAGLSIYGQLGYGLNELSLDQQLVRLPMAMLAAVYGRCEAVEVKLQSDNKSIFHYRNIFNILVNEAHVLAESNPLSGAYFLEVASHKLAENCWSVFQQIEELGGNKWLHGNYSKFCKLLTS